MTYANKGTKREGIKTHQEPLIEDITREFNGGMWTIGYTGQSPERLKAHMKNQHVFR